MGPQEVTLEKLNQVGKKGAHITTSENARHPFPFVSVTIVSRIRRELLARCLRSLENQQCRSFEVIVVDNGSTDGFLGPLRAGPRLRPIKNRANRGHCAANNQTLKIARGNYIALLSPAEVAQTIHRFQIPLRDLVVRTQ